MINYCLGVWQFIVVWQLGFLLEKKLKLDLPYGYRTALAFGLGEVAFSYTYFVLGLVGGLRFWILVPLVGVIFLSCLPLFYFELKQLTLRILPILQTSLFTTLIIAILLLIYALGAMVPEREVDSLWYHLATPLYYIMNDGFIQLVPFNMPSHYPMNVHLHFTLSLLIGNDTTVKAFILCHFIPMLILLFSVAKRYSAARWGLFAVAVYLCCLHFRLPVMSNVQRAVYFHVFLSYALLWWSFETKNWKCFWLSAMFCGMAMGTKFNGLLFGYVGQWLLIAIWMIFICRDQRIKAFGMWCGHSLFAWLMMSPWLLKSSVLTGNPLYPMMGELFPTKAVFVPAMLSNANNHGLNILKSKSVYEFLNQISNNISWMLFNTDLIFFLGILSVIMVSILYQPRYKYPLFSCWIAYGMFTLLWGSDIARLFAVNYGTVIVLIAINVSWICEHPSLKPRMKALFYCFILLSLFGTFIKEKYSYLSSPNIRWFGGIYLSEQHRFDWLKEREIFTPELFRMKDWLDENLDPDETIYGYRTGYLFYLNRKYIVSGAHFKPQVDRWLDQGLEYTRGQFRQLGINYILFDPMGKGNTTNPHPLFQSFTDTYCRIVHQENHLTLYQFTQE